jgi:hypothetical protein
MKPQAIAAEEFGILRSLARSLELCLAVANSFRALGDLVLEQNRASAALEQLSMPQEPDS